MSPTHPRAFRRGHRGKRWIGMTLGQSGPNGAGRLTYEVLGELPAVEAIAAEWDALLEQSPCNRAFSCSKWFLASCRLDLTLRPHVIAARRGAALAGVFPLVVCDGGEVATFASELSDYNDIIARRDDDPVLEGLLRHAASRGTGYRRVVLSRLRHDSNCVRAAGRVAPAGTTAPAFQVRGRCSYVRMASSYEEYLQTRSRSFRKGLRRAQRGADGNRLVVRELEPEHFPPGQIPSAFLSLNLDRWGTESYYRSPFVEAFVLELLPELFAAGRLRAFALFRDEHLLALDLCMVGADSLCSWNGGFLAEAAPWSPGKLLIAAGIEHAHRMKLAEYDLLRGDETYKKSWANSHRDLGWLVITDELRSRANEIGYL
jgi:CelD/BcsL family acetyltransferase involved in cellulose biosynthesis